MTEETSIVSYTPSTNNQLAGALTGLRASVLSAAEANVKAFAEANPGFSQTEIQAMIQIEALRQINGLDLAAVLMRGERINEIIRTNALLSHPGQYQTLQEMASDNGIGLSELSDTMSFVNIIFPYMTETLGMNVALTWERVGKSKMREMVPVLKGLIQGLEEGARESVRTSVTAMLDDTAATLLAAGYESTDDEGVMVSPTGEPVNVPQRAVEQLIEQGVLLPANELRRHIRPERTPTIHASVLRRNGQRMMVASLSEDQWVMFQRKMGTYMDPLQYDLPDDVRTRQIEARRMPEVRLLLGLLEAADG